jgi:hypothetical protein
MINLDISDFLKGIKNIRFLEDVPLPIFLVCMLILFLPRSESFSPFNKFKDSFVLLITIISIISFLVMLVQLIGYIKKKVKQWCSENEKKQYLKKLTTEEKQILCAFIVEEKKAVGLPHNDGNVAKLASKKIIYCASGISMGSLNFSYCIDDNIYEHLLSNRELILNGLPNDAKGKAITTYSSHVPKIFHPKSAVTGPSVL